MQVERDAPLRNTRRPRAGAGGQRGTARFEACRGARRETFDAGQFDLDAHLLTRGPNDLSRECACVAAKA